MAESKLTEDLAELAEQWRDLDKFKFETEVVRRPILLVDAEDKSWSPMRGADEPVMPEGEKMSSKGSLLVSAAATALALGEEAEDLLPVSSAVLSLLLLSSPHNRFISSSTRKKSSSLVEAIGKSNIGRFCVDD